MTMKNACNYFDRVGGISLQRIKIEILLTIKRNIVLFYFNNLANYGEASCFLTSDLVPCKQRL